MNYFIKTFGCQMNFSDSERIRSYLEKNGLSPARTITSAELVIFNTCGVRQTAENRVYGQVHNLRKLKVKSEKLKVVITGCLAARKDVQRKLKGKVDLFFPISEFSKFENWLLKIPAQPNKTTRSDYLSLAPKYSDSSKICVPIMTGCNNYCSYCVVPYARGQEWSRPVDDIIEEIGRASQHGCDEVMLLGQNVNSYKYKKYSFPLILDLLAELYPGIAFSFLTSHPKDFSDELIDVIASRKNISHNIHLPIQSGSNKILKAMNRHYTQRHYLEITDKIKRKMPDAKISTDIVVGFPGETLKDFQETVSVFKKAKFSEGFINKYSPRPGTAAEKLGDPVPWNEKKRREKVLRSLL